MIWMTAIFAIMIKKYIPFIALAGAAFLLWWVISNQRRFKDNEPKTQNTDVPVNTGDNTRIPPVKDPTVSPTRDEGFNRRVSNIIYSKHARCRMGCRHIDESEVKEILETGKVNLNKIESNERGKTYPLEGITHDRQHVRIVFSPKDDGSVVVVTCIDLDTDWQCDCK